VITTLTDYQKQKCWKEGSNLSAINFDRVNILFGHNGAGKSSLASIMAKTHLKDGDVTTARFFGGKYVDSTLLLEDKSGIRGVVSNFGEKDVNIEKQVDANNLKIEGFKEDSKRQASEQETLIDQTEKLIKEIVKRRKDKNKKINNKPENKTVQEKVVLWVKDYEDALKMFPDEDYNVITGNADFSAESERLNLLSIPPMSTIDEGMVNKLAKILETKYKDVEVPDREIVSWLQSGTHIHEEKDHCEFCGADIDITSIKKRVDAYLNDEKHKATIALDEYQQDLESLQKLARDLVETKDTYIQVFSLAENEVKYDSLSGSVQQITTVIDESIREKLKQMGASTTLDREVLSTSIQNIGDALNSLEIAKKRSSQNLLDKINRLETLVKGAIGLEVKNTDSITDSLCKIDGIAKQVELSAKEQKKLRDENERLLGQKSDLADFATYLNIALQDLNLNFSLFPSGKIYVLRHADGSPLKLEDISDGERNLLTLIYFYYEMMGDASGTLKDTIQLIVIDDPISSLDDNNKFYIMDLVKSILDQETVQVFVLSHSWDDFCNLAYGRNHDGVSLFEIKKESGLGNIYPISSGKLLKPYVMLYREVNDFKLTDVNEISDETALHMPNTMRRVLEEYVKFRVNIDFATAGHDDDIAKALFGEALSKLSNTKKQKLNNLLAICNILSHKANHPKNPSEIHESAKFLVGSIEQFDKYHHHKMIGDM
jgi:wobble nucleotide-excising tRNase